MLGEWWIANPAGGTANYEPAEASAHVPGALQESSSGEFALENKTPHHRQRPTRITREQPHANRPLDGTDPPRTEPVDEHGRSVNNHLALFG